MNRHDRAKARIVFEPDGFTSSRPQESGDRQVFNPRNPGDLFERIDRLEEAVRELQKRLDHLSAGANVIKEPLVDIPLAPERKDDNKIEVSSVKELLELDPTSFRDTMIKMLHGQGFKNIETLSDPNVGFGAMTGSRFGTCYAIYTVQEHMSKYSTD